MSLAIIKRIKDKSLQTHDKLEYSKLRPATRQLAYQAISQHTLPESYMTVVEQYLLPIANQLNRNKLSMPPMIIGIQGTQGSGKSTTAVFLKLLLEAEFGLNTAVCSIDDFYLSQIDRSQLANDVHPLLQTRGVPGTHHVEAIVEQFNRLRSAQSLTLPVFDKSLDNPKPESDWIRTQSPIDILIFEGWCVGIPPQESQELEPAINSLEKNEDSDCIWRHFVNDKLANEYALLFKMLDCLIVLQAPSFDCVYRWRQLQEDKLIKQLYSQGKSATQTMSPMQLKRFIQHYQRLTEHALKKLPNTANFLLKLDEAHSTAALINKASEGNA